MKKIITTFLIPVSILFFISIFTSCSCSNDSKDNETLPSDEGIELSDSAARADAQIVIDAPENSSSRERAILDIRAKESRMRANGYEKAADKYIETVSKILDDSTGIVSAHKRV